MVVSLTIHRTGRFAIRNREAKIYGSLSYILFRDGPCFMSKLHYKLAIIFFMRHTLLQVTMIMITIHLRLLYSKCYISAPVRCHCPECGIYFQRLRGSSANQPLFYKAILKRNSISVSLSWLISQTLTLTTYTLGERRVWFIQLRGQRVSTIINFSLTNIHLKIGF